MINPIYFPWSKLVFNECQRIYKEGGMPILDLEITGLCSHGSCIYCDSKTGFIKDEFTKTDIIRIINEASMHNLKWIFICGLGEPLDSPYFLDLLDLISEQNLRLSFFTNGLNITPDIINRLKRVNANLILKLDSFDENIFDLILGKKGQARIIYNLLNLLIDMDFSTNKDRANLTNLALSIVPTKYNIDELPEIVNFCKQNHIFPNIGELEFAGKGRSRYTQLAVSSNDLTEIRKRIDEIWGEEYCRPICPSVFFSLHLTPNGDCVVDKSTGFSCPWFKLKDPSFQLLGSIHNNSITDLLQKMKVYRNVNIDGIRLLNPDPDIPCVFSGCGGKIEEIKSFAIENFYSQKKSQ